ncbi:hypothetical protein CCAX7_40390 [Capsulimonas corticalis]|uniref:Uncharacterized protein n=1 Tax=Capsulimonas corticalis TaxID=2219043 RepID=A0A402D4Q1_9BACT|nr:acyltransferase [Capsulimonas corticalis]BDI31988.1 hypothetical protein CCAX7_40390 [Capsulimonas corticalis]
MAAILESTPAKVSSARRPEAAAHRLDYVDSLRAIAALLVVFDHVFMTNYPLPQRPAAGWGSHVYWLAYGHFGVALFIILSGFCLMLPVIRHDGHLKGGFLSFLKRRIGRIIPPYYLSMGIILLLGATIMRPVGLTWDRTGQGSLLDVALHLTMLHHLTPNNWATINTPYWSLAVEWWIYFAFPLLLLGWRKVGPGITMLAATIVGVALYLPARAALPAACPQFVVLFAIGMLAAEIAYSPKHADLRQRVRWDIFAALGFACVVGLFASHTPWNIDEAWGDLAMSVFVLPLLIVASRPGLCQRLLSAKPLVALGAMSYSLYLMHIPFINLFWRYGVTPFHHALSGERGAMALLFVGVPIIIACCYGFFLAFERPFLRRRGVHLPSSR